jgi:hypothetical protein
VFFYKTTIIFRGLYIFLTQKWHFDQVVNNLLILKTMHFGYGCSFQLFDKGIIELLGPLSLGKGFYLLSKNFSGLHSGFFYKYSFVMLLSLISFIILSLLSFYNFLGYLNILILLFCYSLVILNTPNQ